MTSPSGFELSFTKTSNDLPPGGTRKITCPFWLAISAMRRMVMSASGFVAVENTK
jgi:hypothetical protein